MTYQLFELLHVGLTAPDIVDQVCYPVWIWRLIAALPAAGGPQLRRRENTHLAADAGHDLDHMLELLARMDGAERAAQQRHAVGRGRRHGDVDVDAGLQYGAPEADGGHAVGQVNADHRAMLGTEREAL